MHFHREFKLCWTRNASNKCPLGCCTWLRRDAPARRSIFTQESFSVALAWRLTSACEVEDKALMVTLWEIAAQCRGLIPETKKPCQQGYKLQRLNMLNPVYVLCISCKTLSYPQNFEPPSLQMVCWTELPEARKKIWLVREKNICLWHQQSNAALMLIYLQNTWKSIVGSQMKGRLSFVVGGIDLGA